MSLPTITLSRVTHIGFLEARPAPRQSHEGSCLSVSQEPDAWSYIARLGGLPWWSLTKPDGHFVDYHKLSDTHHQQAQQWALDKGWIKIAPIYRVAQFDEEGELYGHFLLDSHKEALLEADGDKSLISVVTGIHPLPAMEEAIGLRLCLVEAQTWVMVEWLAEVSDADGIWWSDVLDPASLSAPRGGIFQHRVKDWAASPFKKHDST